MKNFKRLKKIIVFLSSFIAIISVLAFTACATEKDTAKKTDKEEQKITVHIFNCYDQGDAYIYSWGDDGEILSAWPGTKLDAPDSNGWYEKEFTAKNDINLVFGFDVNGDKKVDQGIAGDYQTNDLPKLPANIGEFWVIISSEEADSAESLNDFDIDAGASGYVYTIPQDGWPVSDTYVKPDKENYSTEVINLGIQPTKSPEATKTPAKAESESSNDSNFVIYIVIGVVIVAVIAVVIVLFVKKKKKVN